MSFYPKRAHPQREKTLQVFVPCCGAKLDVVFDGTGGERWEVSTAIRCPRGHDLPYSVMDALEDYIDSKAQDGEGDEDPRGLCGHAESQR